MAISLNSDGMNLGAIWNAGLSFGADPSYDTDRTPTTVSVSAIDQMEPVTSSGGFGAWDQIWRDVAKTTVGYLIAKDAAQSGVSTPQRVVTTTPNGQTYVTTGGQTQQAGGGILMLLLVGGLAFMALKD